MTHIKAVELASKAVELLQRKYSELKVGKTVTKKDLSSLEPLISLAQSRLGNLPRNLRFALSCAEETIDKAVHDAKIEIEASVEHKLRQIGLEALQVDSPLDTKQLEIILSNHHLDKP